MTYNVASTPKAPGADGTLLAAVSESQHQTELTLEVKNLAPPDRVAAGSTQYVAWQRKNSDAVWARLGGVEYDPEARTAKLKATVPETQFDFEVTAEQVEAPASPSAEVVLAQHVAKQ